MWFSYRTVISTIGGKSGIALKGHNVEIHAQNFYIYNTNVVLLQSLDIYI